MLLRAEILWIFLHVDSAMNVGGIVLILTEALNACLLAWPVSSYGNHGVNCCLCAVGCGGGY